MAAAQGDPSHVSQWKLPAAASRGKGLVSRPGQTPAAFIHSSGQRLWASVLTERKMHPSSPVPKHQEGFCHNDLQASLLELPGESQARVS